ncbi:MAG: 2-oxo acid dehydrogenase subunit E2 [Deltaproteobacteria bacterium]|nr:2-oxo acid dehydrogenase subunit E2 [Deltaproteobacteria bacterium]
MPMPSLGADMESGTLVKWLRAPGDRVERGDPIAEVETDKGILVIEVFTSGTFERVVVSPGEKVAVGTVLAYVRPRAEVDHAPAAPPASAPAPVPVPAPVSTPPTTLTPVTPPSATLTPGLRPTPALATALPPAPAPRASATFVRASGLARRLAGEKGIDLRAVRGSGPEGAVLATDLANVARAPEPPAPSEAATPDARTKPQSTMRRVIGAAMARSKREVPHFYLGHSVDVGAALAWLAAENEKLPPASRYAPAVLFVWAVARALRKVPELNARWDGDAAPPLPDVHVGCAVALRGGGLVAPAIHHTDRKALPELMAAFRDLVERAKRGGLRTSEMADGTLTVTSLGDRGVEWLLPIIFAPQVAIVGVGRITERPWVRDGTVVARPIVELTLAADHRVIDGHRAASFLGTVGELLQDPALSLVASKEAP